MSLKAAYQRLTATGGKIKLLPGKPCDTLARSANSLLNTDMVLISADVDPKSLEQAWFYIPRMLHSKSVVFHQRGTAQDDPLSYHLYGRAEIEALARSVGKQRAA